jgi:hypothetical protein
MRFTRRAAALAGGVAALALPAAAMAGSAQPVADGNYCMNCTAKVLPGTFHVSKDGKSIDGFTYYDKCAPVPVPKMPKIAIHDGKFSFTGTLVDVTKRKLEFTVKGSFVSSHLATGVVNATGGGKSCKATSFKAKFTRTGPFTF